MRTLLGSAAFLACVAGATAGCSGGGNGGGGGCPAGGIVLLSWTVDGQPPTADQGCAGVASMYLELDGECTDVTIEPIPCINGPRWQYDQLPTGPTEVRLFALDADQNTLAAGSALVDLDTSVPSAPTAIAVTNRSSP